MWFVCMIQGKLGEAPLLGLLGCQAYDHIFSLRTQTLPGKEALASSLHRKLVHTGAGRLGPEAKQMCTPLGPPGFCHLLTVLLG